MSSCRRVTSAMPTAPGGYSALRYKPNAVPLFGWSVLARFQFGVIPLALLLLLSTERHSYAEDGAVTAGYALSAGLLGPVRSRCADRYGHGRLLVVFAGLNAAGLIVLAVLASAPWPLLLVGRSLLGACHLRLGRSCGPHGAFSPTANRGFGRRTPWTPSRRRSFSSWARSW